MVVICQHKSVSLCRAVLPGGQPLAHTRVSNPAQGTHRAAGVQAAGRRVASVFQAVGEFTEPLSFRIKDSPKWGSGSRNSLKANRAGVMALA